MRSRALRLMGGQRTVLFDTFTDPDLTLLHTHVSEDGAPWQTYDQSTGRSRIVGNKLQSQSLVNQSRMFKHRRRFRPNGVQRVDITWLGGTNNDSVGIGFRYCDGTSHFLVGNYAPATQSFNIGRRQGAIESTVAFVSPGSLTQNVPIEFRFEVRKSVGMLFLGGTLILKTDGLIAPPRGGVLIRLGVNSATDPIVQFDNWLVTR